MSWLSSPAVPRTGPATVPSGALRTTLSLPFSVRCVDGWGKHKTHRWVDAAPAWSSWWLNLRGSSGTGTKYRPAN